MLIGFAISVSTDDSQPDFANAILDYLALADVGVCLTM
jgi:hypothetical protein